jgi:Uri superfamily endonuclease
MEGFGASDSKCKDLLHSLHDDHILVKCCGMSVLGVLYCMIDVKEEQLNVT